MAEEITIDGLDELVKKFGKTDILDFLRPAMMRAVLRVQARMAQYPPAPARSKYRRTGTLGRRWTHEISQTGESLTGKVGNNTIYGPYVQSAQFQAWMHVGRWQTDRDVINLERDHIINDFQTTISTALEG